MKHFQETKALLENSNFFYIITTNMLGEYTYINGHYARAFAYISAEFVGQPYHITMHPDDKTTCVEVSTRCFMQPEKLFAATIRKHDGKGGFVVTQWEYKALLDEHNQPAGIFCLGYDITKFVHETQQLQRAETEIEKSNRKLNEIAFQQSHLVRAPLSNILGLADILNKTQADHNVNTLCQMIVESSRQLDDVVRSIVGVSRATA